MNYDMMLNQYNLYNFALLNDFVQNQDTQDINNVQSQVNDYSSSMVMSNENQSK